MQEFFTYVTSFINLAWSFMKSIFSISMTAFNIISGSLSFTISLQALLPTFLGVAVFVFLSVYLVKFIRSFL